MAITNFNFPRVTVNQVFTGADTGADATLPTVVVGPHYNVQDYAEEGSALYIADYAKTAQIFDAYANKTIGSTVDPNSVSVFFKNAALQILASGVGTPQFQTGSLNRIHITSGGSSMVLATNSTATKSSSCVDNVQVGDVAFVTFTPATDEDPETLAIEILAVVTDTNGKNTILLLNNKFASTATLTDIEIGHRADFTLAISNATSATYTVPANVQATLDTTAGAAVQVPVIDGAMYVQYRERLTNYVGKLGVVSGGAYCKTACKDLLNDVTTANPLGIGTYSACLEAIDQMVYFTAVSADTVAAYQNALDFLGKDDTVYNVVIASQDPQIIRACLSMVNAQSALDIPNYRILWYGISNPEATVVASGLTATATASTTVNFAGSAPLLNSGIKAGDYLRYSTQSDIFGNTIYTYKLIAAVVDEDTITMAQALTLSAVTCAIVRKNYDNTDLVEHLINSKCTADRRATMVYADDAYLDGQLVPNFVVAAAAAGMRSYNEPHRPLSNMELNAVEVNETHGLTLTQLRTLGSNGIWLVGNNAQGNAINRRQLTTAAANDVNYDEQSLTTNIDSICKAFKSLDADVVGNSNISPQLISKLNMDARLLMQNYTQYSTTVLVGPQLLSYEIVQIAQDPVVLTRVYLHVKGTPPKPFNQFDITFNLN